MNNGALNRADGADEYVRGVAEQTAVDLAPVKMHRLGNTTA